MGRYKEIREEFRWTSAVCLQGTRLPQVADQPLAFTRLDRFYCYGAGYPRGGNGHAGVSTLLNSRIHPEKYIHFMCFPAEGSLAGRLLAIRSKRPNADVCYITAYFPPSISRNCYSIALSMVRWLKTLLIGLPLRCQPVICCDANTKFGLVASPQEPVLANSGAPGTANPGLENKEIGAILRRLLKEMGLVMNNTIQGAGSTFCNPPPGVRSRIDYISVSGKCSCAADGA